MFWVVEQVYDAFKMCHSHILKDKNLDHQQKPVYEEEGIDSENDSYGDESMKFEDERQTAASTINENDNTTTANGTTETIQDDAKLNKESPISDEFS
jgi:hypothetical protein